VSVIKRGIDIIGAAFGLVILLPALICIAIWIICDNPGPIFFIQKRMGRNGKIFNMIKFRSMVVKQHTNLKVTASNDSRITKAGAWLRRTKIDELPQLWNVLAGDMSLVGPRPEIPEYMEYYPEKDKALVLSVQPGMTDLASLRFCHEEEILAQYDDTLKAYCNKVLPKKLTYIRFYITHQSIGFDIQLIWETIAAICKKTSSTNTLINRKS
jgi:lipopolysaccharide/colanic/teichoic acid biosynthesis glycosyltransferase